VRHSGVPMESLSLVPIDGVAGPDNAVEGLAISTTTGSVAPQEVGQTTMGADEVEQAAPVLLSCVRLLSEPSAIFACLRLPAIPHHGQLMINAVFHISVAGGNGCGRCGQSCW